jgi:hypothetical protein
MAAEAFAVMVQITRDAVIERGHWRQSLDAGEISHHAPRAVFRPEEDISWFHLFKGTGPPSVEA